MQWPFPELTAQEKALVYHYTATGSTRINRLLHTSQADVMAQQLAAAVQKMPVYEGSAYSAAHLDPTQLGGLYIAGAKGNNALTVGKIRWPAFLSTSRSIRVARRHLDYTSPPTPHNCLFLLNSRRGRSVELLSQYGPNGQDPSDSEQEILFLPNSVFSIIGTDFATAFPRIELLEL